MEQITEIITDQSLRQLMDHGTARFPFQHYREDIKKFNIGKISSHWHKEFELVTVVAGTVIFQIGNQSIPVQAGDGIFINTGVIHSLEAKGQGFISDALFSGSLIAGENTSIYEKYVGEFLRSSISHVVLQQKVTWQKEILEILEKLYDLSENNQQDHELKIHILVCCLWEKLFCNREVCTTSNQVGISIRSQARLRLMQQYIESHYSEKITLSQLAEAANISKSEAIRCFQIGMKSSPIDCVNEYRLSQARERILTTDDLITEIAVQSGFDNCSYFDRVFKRKYGMTPRMARTCCHKSTNL